MNLVFKIKVLGFILAIIAGGILHMLLTFRRRKSTKASLPYIKSLSHDDDLLY